MTPNPFWGYGSDHASERTVLLIDCLHASLAVTFFSLTFFPQQSSLCLPPVTPLPSLCLPVCLCYRFLFNWFPYKSSLFLPPATPPPSLCLLACLCLNFVAVVVCLCLPACLRSVCLSLSLCLSVSSLSLCLSWLKYFSFHLLPLSFTPALFPSETLLHTCHELRIKHSHGIFDLCITLIRPHIRL